MAPTYFSSSENKPSKKILNSLVGVVFGAALGIGVSYFTLFGFNKLIFDRESIGARYHSISRADGPFSYTELRSTSKQYEVIKNEFFNNKTITDSNRDGIVDEMIINKIGETIQVTREKSYEQYKKEFDEADKILRETKKRFLGE